MFPFKPILPSFEYCNPVPPLLQCRATFHRHDWFIFLLTLSLNYICFRLLWKRNQSKDLKIWGLQKTSMQAMRPIVFWYWGICGSLVCPSKEAIFVFPVYRKSWLPAVGINFTKHPNPNTGILLHPQQNLPSAKLSPENIYFLGESHYLIQPIIHNLGISPMVGLMLHYCLVSFKFIMYFLGIWCFIPKSNRTFHLCSFEKYRRMPRILQSSFHIWSELINTFSSVFSLANF